MASAWGDSWGSAWGDSWGSVAAFDYVAEGHFRCDRCGLERPLWQRRKEWTGKHVCRECFDHRHPQDFVRGVRDDRPIIGASPEPAPYFLSTNEVSADDL
jgi:hypothetical protein